MPKIIKNLESKLIAEAQKQIVEQGYGAVTIRSVANACGVGVGTVYNYFSSKEELLATYLLEDWNSCITAITAVSRYSDVPGPVVRCIFDQLSGYALRHQAIFRDEAAYSAFAASFGRYHTMLRSQLSETNSEIERIVISEELPQNWTYPQIQPKLMDEAAQRGYL